MSNGDTMQLTRPATRQEADRGQPLDPAADSQSLHGLVSVITPVRNSSRVIERAVRSVAGQSVRVKEHLIIDDGSSDTTARVIDELREEYPWIRYLHQHWNGAAAARNLGIRESQGRYIAFLDSDDVWLPNKLQQQIAFMERTGALFSYGDYQVFDSMMDRVVSQRCPPSRLVYQDLLNACPIGCLTATYNQERLGKIYMPLVKRGQDWGLWLALTRSGTPAYKYPGLEAVYYSRAGSLSSNKLLKCLDIYRIYRRQERKSPLAAIRHLSRFAWTKLWKV